MIQSTESDFKEEANQRSLQEKLIEAAKVKVWADLETIQQLSIPLSGLLQLPTKLCLLTQLKRISIVGNKLNLLPENIGDLKRVQTLSLYANQLTVLPQSLGNLSKLMLLDICNNPNLKQLPKSFQNLKGLKYLYIDWQLIPRQNIFKSEPFASLMNLQHLYIYNDHKQKREAIKKECQQSKIKLYFRVNALWKQF